MWAWRANRLAIGRRLVLAYLIAATALSITASLLPGFSIQDLRELLVAALLFAGLNATSRLFFLWLLAPLPSIGVQLVSVAFQALVLIVLSRIVHGFELVDDRAVVIAAVVLSIVNAALSELARVADDDSYYGTLVRQLVARNRREPRSEVPGMLVIQIDGLSMPVLENAVRAGRMPVVDEMLRSGGYALDPWTPLLPSVTPASQAGILHGRNDGIPGFRWYEKESQRLFVADHPEDADEITRRVSDGRGLLSGGGASVGNLVTGDAEHVYLTMARIGVDVRRFHGFFVKTVDYGRLVVLMVGEFLKELYQAERQRGRGVVPRMHRGLAYAAERAITNVALRTISTSLVIEQLYRPVPIVYVDYTGYNAIAHHCGPEREEAIDALAGIDRSIGALLKALGDAPRPYEVVILSDHGQSLGFTFRQQFGVTLEQVIETLVDDAPRTLGATGGGERRPTPQNGGPSHDLVVAAPGNLALVYLAAHPGTLGAETIDRLYPGLAVGLAKHPGVELVAARSESGGLLLRTGHRCERFENGDGSTAELLRQFGPTAAAALVRLASFDNAGDLLLLGALDRERSEVLSFEELVGSHGGLGGWQTHAFLLHPTAWTLDETPVGATALYGHLWRWRRALEAE